MGEALSTPTAGLFAGGLHQRPEPPVSGHSNILLENLSKQEIPSLFGLRGVAAVVVVVYHYCIEWKTVSFPGYYAVTLFFELSGLLITWLLLKEREVSGTVAKTQFYLRRSLRLFPVFYVVWILCRLRGPFPGSWAYFFYLGDYYTAIWRNYSILTSAWSLGVEEKFYLIWPQVLSRFGLRALARILAAVLVLEPVYRWILQSRGYRNYTDFAFETNLDGIVLGCLIAVQVKRGWRVPRWLLNPFTVVAAVAAGIVLWGSSEVMMFSLGVVLIVSISKPPRALNNRAVKFLGAISYSLYLCQGLTAALASPLFHNRSRPTPPLLGIACDLLIALISATILHYAVERPFLLLKERFHGKTLPGAGQATVPSR